MMHLGSFSRLDIADFDSRGRYPTTPSPQELRTGAPNAGAANVWYPTEAMSNANNMYNNNNGQLTPPDGDQVEASEDNDGNDDGGSKSAVIPQTAAQVPRGSADSSGLLPIANTLQDPATINRASLLPGPRHPQVNHAGASPTAHQPQRTGSKAPAPYPYSPANTAKPLAGAPAAVGTGGGSPINTPRSPQGGETTMPYGSTTLQVQNAPRAQVVPAQPEEVCIECMMRDRDMADVIVTGPGIWDRESDVHIRELIEREDEEERAWRERHAAELAVPGNNKLRPPRRASKGHRLTEQNLKIWLTLNPKESHARLMTIDSYVRQQAALLVIEAEARAKAQQEAQRVDARLSDTYSQIRQSVYGDDAAAAASIRGGAPRSSVYSVSPVSPKDEYGQGQQHQRDMTLLDNGMVVERINLKREEKERKREEKKAGKSSIISFTSREYSPMTPGQPGQMEFVNSGSDYDAPFAAAAAMSSTSLQAQSRPKSAPLGVPLAYTPALSVDGKGGPRFMGSKHYQGGWNSGASVAPSGSMMDMHLALDQEHDQQLQQFGMPTSISRHQAMSSFSLPASPRHQGRPHTADAMMHTRRSTSPDPKAKKSGGLGKLWRMVRPKKSEGRHQTNSFISAPRDEDVSMPLPPPPKMSYLANQRPTPPPHSRQLSTPGSQNGALSAPTPSHHPRSISQPGPYSAGATSPTTAASSTLPSPTSNRFLWRESGGEDRRQSTFKDPNAEAEEQHVGRESESNPAMQYTDPNGNRPLTGGGSASSEYGRMLQPSNNAPLTRSPAPSTMVSSSAHSPRPMSSVHKPLPPPPPSDQGMRQMQPSATMPYNMNRPTTMVVTNEAFMPPMPLRDEGYDARRQSFGGMTTRPDLLPPGAAQSLQTKRSTPAMGYTDSPVNTYQEFGNPYEQQYMMAPYSNGALSDTGKSKRRSRFLPFLSKKDKEKDKHVFAPQQLQLQQQQPQMQQQTNGDLMRYSTYGGASPSQFMPPSRPPFGHSQRSRSSASLTTPDFAPGMNGAAHYSQPFGYNDGGRPMSGISTFTNGTRPNKSLIDEVVPRDNDFLAYRYPSTEQTLDISRR